MAGDVRNLPFLGLDTKEPAGASFSARTKRRACTGLVDKIMDCIYIVIYFVSLRYVNLSGVPFAGMLFIKKTKGRLKGLVRAFPVEF